MMNVVIQQVRKHLLYIEVTLRSLLHVGGIKRGGPAFLPLSNERGDLY